VTDAIRATTDYAFSSLGMHRDFAVPFVRNPAASSRRIFKRLVRSIVIGSAMARSGEASRTGVAQFTRSGLAKSLNERPRVCSAWPYRGKGVIGGVSAFKRYTAATLQRD